MTNWFRVTGVLATTFWATWVLDPCGRIHVKRSVFRSRSVRLGMIKQSGLAEGQGLDQCLPVDKGPCRNIPGDMGLSSVWVNSRETLGVPMSYHRIGDD